MGKSLREQLFTAKMISQVAFEAAEAEIVEKFHRPCVRNEAKARDRVERDHRDVEVTYRRDREAAQTTKTRASAAAPRKFFVHVEGEGKSGPFFDKAMAEERAVRLSTYRRAVVEERGMPVAGYFRGEPLGRRMVG